jgi:predicted phosphodiesterase
MNDIHDRPESIKLLYKTAAVTPDFVFLNGDMFNYTENEKQIITNLFAPCSELFAYQTPLLFSRGNHDMRGVYARALKDYFVFGNAFFYTYQSGPVFTVVLDTGEEEVAHPFDQSVAYRQQQAAWFESIAQSDAYKNAKFRVVKMHIPPQYSFDNKGSKHCRQLFSPLFDKHKVDIVFSGHTHEYGVYPPAKGKHDYALIIGGGRYDGTRAIINVKANEAALSARIIKEDGSSAGELTIQTKQV